MSQQDYDNWINEQERKWEALCGRCGACCGAVDDPCEHLRGDKPGAYYCNIYDQRFGAHQTISGKPLNCVPIRNILHLNWPGDHCCGYKNKK